jgi:hypothetical protein
MTESFGCIVRNPNVTLFPSPEVEKFPFSDIDGGETIVNGRKERYDMTEQASLL